MPKRAPWRPSRDEIAAAAERRIPDVAGPGLHVLFCGINPSLFSAAVGHHFARPGNRFWKALHGAGFTERLLSPFEDSTLLERGLGITNLVGRATAQASELSAGELRRGAALLERKIRRLQPEVVAVLGVGAYRLGFGDPDASVGPIDRDLAGAALWVLPNPSGLNAHWQLPALITVFARLRKRLLR